ncbi:MAG: hypothetical protein WA997_18070 [Anaerolineales bacterium]|nr:hypothetical protein [Anaerolineales bacterium]
MDISGVILLAGIGVVIGFLLAALIFSLRKESSTEQVPQQQLLSDSENKIRVWREGGDQRLVVEMNGVSHRQESDLHTDQKRLLVNLTRELQSWIGSSTTAAAESAAQADIIKTALPQTDEVKKSPSLNPLKVFSDSLQPLKKSELDVLDQSIVSQIDSILQNKMEGTHLEERGVRLVEGPDQGMVIEIGLDKYTEIEAIPDEQIRNLIRLSVAEWEKSVGD